MRFEKFREVVFDARGGERFFRTKYGKVYYIFREAAILPTQVQNTTVSIEESFVKNSFTNF